MPKMKTKSSAKKRFRLTATGQVRFNSANRRHRLISKRKQAKERNQGTKIMAHGDAVKVRRQMLPNG
ncbi:MAG: 50S ribosomal protein L35 [Rhodospirillaceae bacterium]|nr:50S ribosomal protein L35 [Rhodospirillaceae bacterium]